MNYYYFAEYLTAIGFIVWADDLTEAEDIARDWCRGTLGLEDPDLSYRYEMDEDEAYRSGYKVIDWRSV